MSVCAICDGVGLVRVVNSAGKWISRACDCQEMEREQRRLAAAHIPERYRHCSLDNYVTVRSKTHTSQREARRTACSFVNEFPVGTGGKGLLFTGSIGVGKTHLAVGVLSRRGEERGVKGLFGDSRELLKSIQNSYNAQFFTTKPDPDISVLAPEVLLPD